MSSRKDRVRVVAIHRLPPHFSAAPGEFRKKIEGVVNSLLAIPTAQENFLKLDMMMPNNQLESHIQALGLPAAEPTIVGMAECESWDHFVEIFKDPAFKSVFGDSIKDFGFDVGNCTFAVDVVTKIDKA
ncbi:hypothetical protein B0H11DRAFT_2288319 [Mycena galericulata]|nr:hypothetical protein B0H11DRAFT_2288319 [Mycena galericulata]